MASAKAIISAVNSKHPDLTVTDIFNYSDGWIVIAKKDPNSKDEADPFYKVTKNGEVVDISSADDPMGFRRALSAGAVWSNKGTEGVKHDGMKGKSLSHHGIKGQIGGNNMDKYLAHHGVKGQKWGVRRWQNSDGSLTPDGKIHYGKGNKKEAEGTKDNKSKSGNNSFTTGNKWQDRFIAKEQKRSDRNDKHVEKKLEKLANKYKKTNNDKYSKKFDDTYRDFDYRNKVQKDYIKRLKGLSKSEYRKARWDTIGAASYVLAGIPGSLVAGSIQGSVARRNGSKSSNNANTFNNVMGGYDSNKHYYTAKQNSYKNLHKNINKYNKRYEKNHVKHYAFDDNFYNELSHSAAVQDSAFVDYLKKAIQNSSDKSWKSEAMKILSTAKLNRQ